MEMSREGGWQGTEQRSEDSERKKKKPKASSHRDFCLLAGFAAFPPHPDSTQFDTGHKHQNLLFPTKTRVYIKL